MNCTRSRQPEFPGNMLGFLNIHKPPQMTSRDVVTRIVSLIRESTGEKWKAGHAGTLDPLAEGVLLIALGRATKMIPFVQSQSKSYQARFQLDASSASVDLETEVIPLANPKHPTLEELIEAAEKFTGDILQKPPAYSAISIKGRRAYQLVRKGIEFEIEAKPVQIHRLVVERYSYPDVSLHIDCGSGTYIRSLGRDLARSIGSDAVMTDLTRTAVGPFLLQDAIALDELTFSTLSESMCSIDSAIPDWPQVELTDRELLDIKQGRFLELDPAISAEYVLAISDAGQPAAILEPSHGKWKPKINFGS